MNESAHFKVAKFKMFSRFCFLMIIFWGKFHLIVSQDEILICRYYNDTNWGAYACDLTIYNPNGLNNFTKIDGTHLSGKSDENVTYIFRDRVSVTTIVPSIICEQFKNLLWLELSSSRIQKLDENSFSNCTSLETLDISSNLIDELSKNVFKPLTKLHRLIVEYLNLKVIHADSFGVHLNLMYLYLRNNKIDAFDERIIDKTTVSTIYMTNNTCANSTITDNTVLRSAMRTALKTCIENYENLTFETTTTLISTTSTSYTTEFMTTITPTLPPGCHDGNLNERVCHIEDEVLEFHHQNKNVTATLDDLQYQIKELSNRPCACL